MKTVRISLNSIDKVKSFVNDLAKFDVDFDLARSRLICCLSSSISTSYCRGSAGVFAACTLHREGRRGHLGVELKRVGKRVRSKCVAAEGFGRYKKARDRIGSDPALCAGALLFGLSQQA